MRKFCLTAMILSLSMLAFAQNPSKTVHAKEAADAKPQTFHGHLVDVACATENAEKPRAGFAEKHDKSCLEMPDCAKSGYALLTADNQVLKFDAKGNAAAKELISSSKRDKNWQITATGALNKDVLTVSDLKLD